MHSATALAPVFALIAGLAAYVASHTRPPPEPSESPRVRLAVLVVFDQMRGDYVTRWNHLYGRDGFRRLTRDGAWYPDCHYPYGVTTTGPGHASLLTGTSPDRHGIVNNNWFERGADTYCAADSRYSLVPGPPIEIDAKTGKPIKPPAGGTPERLRSETVADVLKRSYGPRAKVFGLSLKDRSAVLPTGRSPDGAFWFDGRIVTSTYYTDHLGRGFPKWAESFNRAPPFADRWFGRAWDRFRADVDYDRFGGTDEGVGEGSGTKQGRTFPHPMNADLKRPGKEYYSALANSPFGNELLLEVAKQCILSERLGVDSVPDLLVVSFSSNDLIGHTWGPDSQEVLDATLRTDALLADLLRFLDAKVGRDQYLLGLTADHGICPLPEVSRRKSREAERVSLIAMQERAEAALRQRFGLILTREKSNWIEAVSFPWFYLNPRLIQATGRSREEVSAALAKHLGEQPDVARAFTRFEPVTDDLHRRMMRSFHPERCGDVGVVLQPWDLPSGRNPNDLLKVETGTTHGSPYAYDTHVPLIAYGSGIRGGARDERVTPQSLAAIFSRALRIRPPADAEYPVPATLYSR